MTKVCFVRLLIRCNRLMLASLRMALSRQRSKGSAAADRVATLPVATGAKTQASVFESIIREDEVLLAVEAIKKWMEAQQVNGLAALKLNLSSLF